MSLKMTNGKSKVPVNLDNYPSLKELAGTNKEEFLTILKTVFSTMDRAVGQGHHKDSKEYFGIAIQDLVGELLGAMFDHKGIIDHLPNKSNAEALSEMYGHALNPLYAAFTKDGLMNHEGSPVSFEEKFGMTEEKFSVKVWLQGLLFYSYYCSLPDFAEYLALNDFALVDEEKHANISKLLEIKPVLAYQKAIGILPGKLYPETGFFDTGDLNGATVCPACQDPEDSLFSIGEVTICTNCKGAFKE